MADRLVIHGADLQEAYSRIVFLHGEFDSATSRSNDAASYVGHAGLKSELENVAGSWRIHREKLLKSLEDIESQIKGTLDTFSDVDKKMADNLHPDTQPSGQNGTSGGTSQVAPTAGQQAGPGDTRTQQVATPSPQASPLAENPVQATSPAAPAAVQDTQSTDSGATSPPAGTPPGIDTSAYPPELQALVSKLGALVTSPDFIAKYPQFAAGAGLGALLPLLLAGAAASRSGSGGVGSSPAGGQQSATQTVRGLLDGVKKDMSDGHLDTMTPAQARAELDRLLGPDKGAPVPDPAGGSIVPDQSTTAPDAAHPDMSADPSPAEAPKSDTTGGSSAGTSGGASTPAPDFRAGSPMLKENPDTVGQVPASSPSGAEAAVTGSAESAASAAPSVGGVSSDGSSSSASNDPGSVSTAHAAETGIPGRPSTAPSQIPTPMMAPGSMGSVGAGGGGGTSTGPSQPPPSSSPPGGPSSPSSSRHSSEKADARKSQETEETRTERNSR